MESFIAELFNGDSLYVSANGWVLRRPDGSVSPGDVKISDDMAGALIRVSRIERMRRDAMWEQLRELGELEAAHTVLVHADGSECPDGLLGCVNHG